MFIRTRLCIMMFLQYFTWGAWGVEIFGYMGVELKFTGAQIGAIGSTTAIAAMVSPLLMGYLADRLFSTERLLAVLHLLGAVLLFAAYKLDFVVGLLPVESSDSIRFLVLWGLIMAYALCYMPTLALTNSISFENIKSAEKEFPLIRVFGTFGWIAAGLAVGLVLKTKEGGMLYSLITGALGADSWLLQPSTFLALAAACSAVLGLFSFFLPHTPPKHESDVPSGERKSVISLLEDRSFLVFVVASFLVCIPLAFYYTQANNFLQQVDILRPATAIQTVGQFSEIFFMAAMPLFIAWLGVKRMLAIGMLAWGVRYILFALYGMPGVNIPALWIGLALHGICYDFFFVASQIYTDSKVDPSQRARAQSFLAFVTLGMGMLVGSNLGGYIVDSYPPVIGVTGTKVETITTKLPDWDAEGKGALAKSLGLKDDKAILNLETIQEPVVITSEDGKTQITYGAADLQAAARQADVGSDNKVSHQEWTRAQANNWYKIWLWPAGGALVTLLMFWFTFHDKIATAPAKH